MSADRRAATAGTRRAVRQVSSPVTNMPEPTPRTVPLRWLTYDDADLTGRLLIGYCYLKGLVAAALVVLFSFFRWTDLLALILIPLTPGCFRRSLAAARLALAAVAVLLALDLLSVLHVLFPGLQFIALPLDPMLRRWWVAADVIRVIIGVVALVLLLRAVRRARYTAPDTCRWCGYDVRESKDRCPECGRLLTADILAARKVAAALTRWSQNAQQTIKRG